MTKKIISLLLVLMMVMSLLPVSAFAAEDAAEVEELAEEIVIVDEEPVEEPEEAPEADAEAPAEPAEEPADEAEEVEPEVEPAAEEAAEVEETAAADEPALAAEVTADKAALDRLNAAVDAAEAKIPDIEAGKLHGPNATAPTGAKHFPDETYKDAAKEFYTALEAAWDLQDTIKDKDIVGADGIIDNVKVNAAAEALEKATKDLTTKRVRTDEWKIYGTFFGSTSAAGKGEWKSAVADIDALVEDLAADDGWAATHLQPEYIAKVKAAVETAQAVLKKSPELRTYYEEESAIQALRDLREEAYTEALLANKDDIAELKAAVEAYKKAKEEAEKTYKLDSSKLTAAETVVTNYEGNKYTTTSTLKRVLDAIAYLDPQNVEDAKIQPSVYIAAASAVLDKPSQKFGEVDVTLAGDTEAKNYYYIVTYTYGGVETAATAVFQADSIPTVAIKPETLFESGKTVTIKVYSGTAKSDKPTPKPDDPFKLDDYLKGTQPVDTYVLNLNVSTNDYPIIMKGAYVDDAANAPAWITGAAVDTIYVSLNKDFKDDNTELRIVLTNGAQTAVIEGKDIAAKVGSYADWSDGTPAKPGQPAKPELIAGTWYAQVQVKTKSEDVPGKIDAPPAPPEGGDSDADWSNIGDAFPIVVSDITAYEAAKLTKDITKTTTGWAKGYDELVNVVDQINASGWLPNDEAAEEAMTEALETANEIISGSANLANSTANQKDVDAAIAALEAAWANYDEQASTEKLEELLAEANAKVEEDYTAASWRAAKLADAIAQAEEAVKIVASASSKEAEKIAAAEKALTDAFALLVAIEPSNDLLAELKKAIEDAQKALDEAGDDITDESKEALLATIKDAQDVLDDENATVSDVNNAIADLKAAVDALAPEKEPVDTEELEAAIEEAQAAIDDEEANYTDESVAAVEAAIEAAKAVLEKEDATQEEVDAALADLKAAVDALEEKGNDEPPVDEPTTPDFPATSGWWQDEATGDWYLLENGTPVTGWDKSPNTGLWYHFGENGVMDLGFFTDTDGRTYYLKKTEGNQGSMVKGWQLIDGEYYYFSKVTSTSTGKKTGEMYENEWVKSANGKWYYLGEGGVMLTNTTTPDGYKVDATGAWVK